MTTTPLVMQVRADLEERADETRDRIASTWTDLEADVACEWDAAQLDASLAYAEILLPRVRTLEEESPT